MKNIFYCGLTLFLIIGIRNTITYTQILNDGLSKFTFEDNFENKTYFDLGDYLSFTNKIRDELDLDKWDIKYGECKIYIESFQDWPYTTHRSNYYLKPCERVQNKEEANYEIYYKKSPDNKENIKVEFNGSYLLDNNKN